MTCLGGHRISVESRRGSTETLGGELKRFLLELGLVCALLMVLGQTFPALAGQLDGWTPVCTKIGISWVEDQNGEKAPVPECQRCTLCITSHHGFSGIPAKGSVDADLIVADSLDNNPFAELSVTLPDHLLPFSGAPPPAKNVDFMQHMFSVSVSHTPPIMYLKPGVHPWL